MNHNSLFLYSVLTILPDIKSNHEQLESVSGDQITQVITLIEQSDNAEHLTSPELEAYLSSYKSAAHKLVCRRFEQFPLPL